MEVEGDAMEKATRKRRDGTKDTKTNGKAVPAIIDSCGMVWIFPGGGLEKALLHSPPTENMIPEIEKDGFRPVIWAVRDFLIDWTILLENIVRTVLHCNLFSFCRTFRLYDYMFFKGNSND